MTIVLQPQFWDLTIEDEQFTVTLSFKNRPAELVIPFDALSAFVDPSVKFGLQFTVEGDGKISVPTIRPEGELVPVPEPADIEASEDTANEDGETDGAEVVSLDQFRKK